MSAIMGHIPTLVFTGTATAPIAERQLVGFDDAPAGADAPVKGIAMSAAATGEPFPILALGTVDLVAVGAVAAGDALSANAAGAAVAGGTAPFGRALTSTTGPGQRVQVLVR